jgi:hypothetical protein
MLSIVASVHPGLTNDRSVSNIIMVNKVILR